MSIRCDPSGRVSMKEWNLPLRISGAGRCRKDADPKCGRKSHEVQLVSERRGYAQQIL